MNECSPAAQAFGWAVLSSGQQKQGCTLRRCCAVTRKVKAMSFLRQQKISSARKLGLD